MNIAVLLSVGVVGAIALILLLVFRRDVIGVDLSARSLLRLYLYVASLTAAILLSIGLGAGVDWGMASAFGGEAVYGRQPTEMPCPVGQCPSPQQLAVQYAHQREQQQQQDLILGITFTVVGALFWGAHRAARAWVAGPEERTSALRRAYLTLGVFVFGLGAIVLVPTGIYNALSVALIAPRPDTYHSGVGGSLAGGIVALAIFGLYVAPLARDFRVAKALPRAPMAGPARPLTA